MRNISGAALLKIAEEQGTEPLILVGISWVKGAQEILYGDKTLPGVEGRILELGSFSSSLDVDDNTSVGEVSITLSDYDGALKYFFDNYDIHKRPVTVYQTFEGLALNEKFPIFPNGQITSPIVWDEAARTLSFSISTKVEDAEAGFSTESAALDRYSKTDEKNWPLCFGDVFYVPATQVNDNPSGQLKTSFGTVDPLLGRKLQILEARSETFAKQISYLGSYYGAVSGTAPDAIAVLDEYIKAIGEHDRLERAAKILLEAADKIDELIKKSGGIVLVLAALKLTKAGIMATVKNTADQIATIVAQKDTVNEYIQGIEYEIQVHKSIIDKISSLIAAIFENNDQILEMRSALQKQAATARTYLIVENGDKFPQGVSVDVLIKDVRFSGSFSGNALSISSGLQPKYRGVGVVSTAGVTDKKNFTIVDETIILSGLYCLVQTSTGTHVVKVSDQDGVICTIDLVEKPIADPVDPPEYNTGDGIQRYEISGFSKTRLNDVHADPVDDTERGNIIKLEELVKAESDLQVPSVIIASNSSKYIVEGQDIQYVIEAAPMLLPAWLSSISETEANNIGNGMYFADIGSEVTLADLNAITWVANVLPSTIYNVHAYKIVDGTRALVQVPTNYYTKDQSKNLEDITITTLTLKQNLSRYSGQEWEDQLYVTLRSSVGPNVVNIIKHLLATYTDYEFDTTTFDYVFAKLIPYPANFAIFERKNVIEFIKEIAFQSRCAVWQSNGVYYIKYISEEADSVGVITDDEVLHESLKLNLSDTEVLGTKIVATWRQNYLEDEPNTLTLRHNIAKYGTQEFNYDWYIYTNKDLVEKSATFWLIRKANSWKRVSFDAPLTCLNYETFDTVTLSLACLGGDINAIVTSAEYDSSSNTIRFECWLPIKAGTTIEYALAYPSSATSSLPFPTDFEVEAGYAGSGVNVVGSLTGQALQGYTSRPPDWGRQYNNDVLDISSASPPLNLFAVEDIVPRPNVGTFAVPPFPEELRELNSEERPQQYGIPRDVYYGTVVKLVNSRIFGVKSQTGEYVEATQYRIFNDAKYEVNDTCIIIRGNGPKQWFIQAVEFAPDITIMTVKEVHGSYLICNDEEDKPQTVAKPIDFWRSSYDGRTIDGKSYAMITPTRRSLTVTGGDHDETFFQDLKYVNIDDQIIVGKLPFGAIADGTECPYIDLNVGGYNWEYSTAISGRCSDAKTLGRFDYVWMAVINSGGGSLGVYCKAYMPNYTTGHYIEIDTCLTCEYSQVDDRYIVVEEWPKARRVLGTLDTQLWRAEDGLGTDIIVDVISHWDGYDPRNDEGKVVAYNLMHWEGSANNYVILHKQENGTYIITNVRNHRPDRIRFKLTENLALNGNAAVDILEARSTSGGALISNETSRVYDVHGIFEGGTDDEGMAEWKHDKQRYEVFQMNC
jgi:hypothetical protein